MNTSMPVVYLSYIWEHAIAIAQVLLFLIIYIMILKIKKENFRTNILIITCSIFMYIYLSPNFVQRSLQLFSCRTIDDESYLVANVSKKCYTSEFYHYTLLLIFPIFSLWVLLLPIILFFNLRKHARKGHLERLPVRYKYGYLYNEYDIRVYWWEFVKIYEKILIMTIL